MCGPKSRTGAWSQGRPLAAHPRAGAPGPGVGRGHVLGPGHAQGRKPHQHRQEPRRLPGTAAGGRPQRPSRLRPRGIPALAAPQDPDRKGHLQRESTFRARPCPPCATCRNPTPYPTRPCARPWRPSRARAWWCRTRRPTWCRICAAPTAPWSSSARPRPPPRSSAADTPSRSSSPPSAAKAARA